MGSEGQERLGGEREVPDVYEIVLDTETVIAGGNHVYRTVISRGEEPSPSKGDRPLVVFDHEQIAELGPGERVSYFGRYTGKVAVETELEILEDCARCLVLFLNERRERMGRSI